jgi:hypothetical protein
MAMSPPRQPAFLPDGWTFGALSLEEARVLRSWAAQEGWNPGLHDLEVAYAMQPEAFVGLRRDSELVGAGAITVHGEAFGFMGLFILVPEVRGLGLGGWLWHERLRLLKDRLGPQASVGMDGVLAMEPFYARGGFRREHLDLRFEGAARGARSDRVVPLEEVDPGELTSLVGTATAAARPEFLEAWWGAPGVRAGAILEEDRAVAVGVLRPAEVGHKFGPVVARCPQAARELILDLMARVPGEQVQLDLPEPNSAAVEFARERGLEPVFQCARMVSGVAPSVRLEHLWGITSFEFG